MDDTVQKRIEILCKMRASLYTEFHTFFVMTAAGGQDGAGQGRKQLPCGGKGLRQGGPPHRGIPPPQPRPQAGRGLEL